MRPNINDILHYYPEITGIHPACEAVPAISDEDYAALLQSIKDGGLAHEIVLTKDGKLLDGRNRLCACYEANQDIRFEYTGVEPWQYSYDTNIARRHLSAFAKYQFKEVWIEAEREAARQRQEASLKQNADIRPGNISLTESGQSRDKIGAAIGISGKSVDKCRDVQQYAPPEVKQKAASGDISLEEAYREARKVKQQSQSQPTPKPEKVSDDQFVTIITAKGVESKIPKPNVVRFNQTNDSVDWASWTWNPVTGCEHGCKFCYAREIANSQRMAAFYPNKFEPTYHPYRLSAPKNTSIPKSDDQRDGRVFVCSMADLFGKWVPDQWIESVFEACLEAPDWEYMFLTKWPARYSRMPLLPKAWYGSSVIQQSDVNRVEKAMADFDTDCVKWISLEPMLEPIRFNDISWCDLVVIGAQTSTTQPEGFVAEFAPEFDWVVDIVNQCREFGVPYYIKANLGMERPGMKLPKPGPRVREAIV